MKHVKAVCKRLMSPELKWHNRTMSCRMVSSIRLELSMDMEMAVTLPAETQMNRHLEPGQSRYKMGSGACSADKDVTKNMRTMRCPLTTHELTAYLDARIKADMAGLSTKQHLQECEAMCPQSKIVNPAEDSHGVGGV